MEMVIIVVMENRPMATWIPLDAVEQLVTIARL
jgi:hypothetical protein